MSSQYQLKIAYQVGIFVQLSILSIIFDKQQQSLIFMNKLDKEKSKLGIIALFGIDFISSRKQVKNDDYLDKMYGLILYLYIAGIYGYQLYLNRKQEKQDIQNIFIMFGSLFLMSVRLWSIVTPQNEYFEISEEKETKQTPFPSKQKQEKKQEKEKENEDEEDEEDEEEEQEKCPESKNEKDELNI